MPDTRPAPDVAEALKAVRAFCDDASRAAVIKLVSADDQWNGYNPALIVPALKLLLTQHLNPPVDGAVEEALDCAACFGRGQDGACDSCHNTRPAPDVEEAYGLQFAADYLRSVCCQDDERLMKQRGDVTAEAMLNRLLNHIATLTQHLNPPVDGAVEEALDGDRAIIANLVNGIRWWAAQEDGIPEEVWEAYGAAMLRLGWSISAPVDMEALEGLAALTTAQQEAEKAREALREACDDMFDLDLDALREQWAIADSAGRLTPSEYRAEWVSRKVDEYLATHDGGDTK